MRRILLLGMAVLLGMATHADDRQVVFEETFASGLGDFIVVDEGFPDPKPETWHWAQDGCAIIEQSQLSGDYRGYSYLTSPVIDLTNWHNVAFTFEYNVMADDKIYTLQFKDGDSEWKSMEGWIYTESVDEFKKSKTYYLSRYNGHQVQIRFLVMMNKATKFHDTNKIRNVRFEGEEGAASDEPIKVANIQEFLSLPEYTFAEIELDTALFTCTSTDLSFMKDNSAAMCCRGMIGNKNKSYALGPFPGLQFKGKMSGVRTFQYGYNELSDGMVDGTEIYPTEMFEGGRWTPFTKIDESQIEEYDCQNITVELRDPEMLFYYDRSDFCEESYTKQYTRRVGCSAVAYLTPDHKKRLLFLESGYVWGIFSDEEPYSYNDYLDLPGGSVRRPLKRNQWNTASFPFDISKSTLNNYLLKDSKCAVLSDYDNGTFVFRTVDFDNNEIIEAGNPCLIKPSRDLSGVSPDYGNLTFEDVSGQTIVPAGDYNFVGTLEPVQPADGSYYLTEGNTIKPLASGGTIKAYRAYFEPTKPNAAKARAISIDGMTTAIDDIEGGEELFGLPQKVYTVNGQYVGDDLESLPKGVYIVNGKKIIK